MAIAMHHLFDGYSGHVADGDDMSVEGARAAQGRGELGRWVGDFLRSPGSDNAGLADELVDGDSAKSSWHGPIELPFDDLNRLGGPPDQPTLEQLDDNDLDTVAGMEDSIDDGWEPAPLIVSYNDGQLVVEDGNHRIEGLRRAGHSRYWSIVGFENEQQRQEFLDTGS